jgi:hypothetical protein
MRPQTYEPVVSLEPKALYLSIRYDGLELTSWIFSAVASGLNRRRTILVVGIVAVME